jgi:hypothetical protein
MVDSFWKSVQGEREEREERRRGTRLFALFTDHVCSDTSSLSTCHSWSTLTGMKYSTSGRVQTVEYECSALS